MAGSSPASVAMADPAHQGLTVGTRVEVRSRFDGRWSRGFVVEDVDDRGYRVRRRSDDSVLPAVFGDEEVRRERREGLWWT